MLDNSSTWHDVSTIADVLVRAATLTPHRRAVVFYDDELTYAQSLERARDIARGLAALGVRRGDHVGILLPNGPEFVEAFFGVTYLGAVIVPLNPRYRAHELGYALGSGDIVTLITSGFEDAYADFPAIVEACAPGLAECPEATALHVGALPRLRSVVLLGGPGRHGFVDRERFLALGREVPLADVEEQRQSVRVRDVAVILYTSGTTANPKGCILSHEAVMRGPVDRARNRYRTREQDVTWSAGPLFHMGCLQQLIGSIGAGGTFVTDTYYDAGRAIELTRREHPTINWALFPAIITPILTHPDFDPADFADLRRIVLIGPRSLLVEVQKTFPQAELITVCGMSEMAGIYAVSGEHEDAESRAETQGRPLPGTSVRIVSLADGTDANPHDRGELWVRGPSMMEGYYNDPAKTAEAIDADGWLHTGDVYHFAPNGNLVFDGRIKDMLKVGGENVSALEIEAFLCGHPDVLEAAVIGIPDERMDEVPVAFVELRAGASVTADELVGFCTGRIARYKVPRAVHFVGQGDWPMSTTKIDKTQLRLALETLTP